MTRFKRQTGRRRAWTYKYTYPRSESILEPNTQGIHANETASVLMTHAVFFHFRKDGCNPTKVSIYRTISARNISSGRHGVPETTQPGTQTPLYSIRTLYINTCRHRSSLIFLICSSLGEAFFFLCLHAGRWFLVL